MIFLYRDDGDGTGGQSTDDDGAEDGTDERIEDDNGDDGTDTTGQTYDTYSSKVSSTTLGPSFCRKSKLTILSGHAQTLPAS